MLWPHYHVLIDILGLLRTKMKADTKLAVVMWCHICDKKFTAPSWTLKVNWKKLCLTLIINEPFKTNLF